jgi:hypothetical protein
MVGLNDNLLYHHVNVLGNALGKLRVLLENSVGEFWSLTPQAEFSARLNQKTGTPSKHSTQEAIRQYKIPLASNVAMRTPKLFP